MIRQHHRIQTAVALSAVAAAFLVAGCGGSSPSSRAGAVNLDRAAYVSSPGAGYQLAIKVTGHAGGQPIDVTGAGTFDQAAHAGRLAMNVGLPDLGENPRIDAVILGEDVYVKLPASAAGNVPGGKPWLELNLAAAGKASGIQGLSSLVDNPAKNPAQLLEVLRAASTGGFQNLGPQTIDGVSTTRLRGTIDLSKIGDSLPGTEQQTVSSGIASIERLTGLRYLPVEAWVDSSDRVRRILMSETGRVKGQPFSENVRVDIVKYGPEPVPATPPAHEVTNITSMLGTL